MKIIRDFDTLTPRQKKIAIYSTLPLGILMSLGFDQSVGVPIDISVRNLIIVITLSMLAGLVIRGLRTFGIDLWKDEKPKQNS